MTNQRVGMRRSAIRGLSTVALIRANFDARHDHIDMFVPFILDAIKTFATTGFGIDDLQTSLEQRCQLAIPINTLKIIIGRVSKLGFVRRDGGRYFLTEKEIIIADLVVERAKIETRQQRLASELCNYAKSHGLGLLTTEEALSILLKYLEENLVSIVLSDSIEEQYPKEIEETYESEKSEIIVASFLQFHLVEESPLAAVIQEMIEGLVLQNALLLNDISDAVRKFNNLEVYIDTRLLLGLLGYRGRVIEIATKEAFSILKERGAVLAVYNATIQEAKRILALYQHRLSTAGGALTLIQNDITRYFLTNHYTSSEIASIIALLVLNINGQGINIRDLPKHRPEFTLGEKELSGKLVRDTGDENEPRIIHDVDCIAGVLTNRAGREYENIENAKAIFVTTSSLLVKNVCKWYEEQGGKGVPPIIHNYTLSNIAWLKKPSSSSTLKLHELVAICGAALRPTRKVWMEFIQSLTRLRNSGELSSEETVAIVVSTLTERIISEELIDDGMDAATFTEVIQRVKASYSEKADERVAEILKSTEKIEKAALDLRNTIERRARLISKIVCLILVLIIVIIMVFGFMATIISYFEGKISNNFLLISAVLFGLASLLSILWGFNIRNWKQTLEERMSSIVKKWISGE